MLYKGRAIGMVIALPKKDTKDVEDPQKAIAEIEDGFAHVFEQDQFDVAVTFPKFKLDYECDGVSAFRELGITELFAEVFIFSEHTYLSSIRFAYYFRRNVI
jgi:serine protease inhibitor